MPMVLTYSLPVVGEYIFLSCVTYASRLSHGQHGTHKQPKFALHTMLMHHETGPQ